jgi:hypothetical protein
VKLITQTYIYNGVISDSLDEYHDSKNNIFNKLLKNNLFIKQRMGTKFNISTYIFISC